MNLIFLAMKSVAVVIGLGIAIKWVYNTITISKPVSSPTPSPPLTPHGSSLLFPSPDHPSVLSKTASVLSKTASVLLLGAPGLNSIGVARPAAEFSLEGTKYPDPNTWYKSGGALLGVERDIVNFTQYFKQVANANIQAHCNITTGADAKELIKNLFSHKSDHYFLYYTGHGYKGTGDWCFGNDLVSLGDILGMWNARGIKQDVQSLIIVADCCYSGSWAKDPRVFKQAQDAQTFPNIVVQAACQHNEKSQDTPDGGMFTLHFLWAQTSLYPLTTERFKDPKFLPTCSIKPVVPTGKKLFIISIPLATKGLRLLEGWALERNYPGWFKKNSKI